MPTTHLLGFTETVPRGAGNGRKGPGGRQQFGVRPIDGTTYTVDANGSRTAFRPR
jgi:hypothetical protein